MGWVWSERSHLYLIGVICLVMAVLAFAAGHVAPYWVTYVGELAQNRSELNVGLWFQCQSGHCDSQLFSIDEMSLKTVRILQVLGLLLLVISLMGAFFANCRRQHPGHSFFLEAVIALGAVLGLSGSMVYLARTKDMVEASNNTHYDWAFALNIAASVMALFAAAFIFIANLFSYLHRADHDNNVKKASDHDQNSKTETAMRNNDHRLVNGSFPMSVPPADYSFDLAVNGREAYHATPMETNQASGRRHGGAEMDGNQVTGGREVGRFPDSRGGEVGGYPGSREVEMYARAGGAWSKIATRMTPPRNFYGEHGHLGIRSEPGDLDFRGVGPEASSRAFMLPRVVVRGFYEPGRGYPEYIML